MKNKVNSRGGGGGGRGRGGDSRLSVKKGRVEKAQPKFPPNAFFLFLEEFRKKYKKNHPTSKQDSVVAKAAGEEWRSLNDDEKVPYTSKANKLWIKYTKERVAINNLQSGFLEGPGDSNKSDSREYVQGESSLSMERGRVKYNKPNKVEKDPNKPKRPPNAFFIFMQTFRKDYKESYPHNKKISRVSRAGKVKWKSWTDDDKAPYVAKAEALNAEYTKKINAYNSSRGITVNGRKRKALHTKKIDASNNQEIATKAKKCNPKCTNKKPQSRGQEATDESECDDHEKDVMPLGEEEQGPEALDKPKRPPPAFFLFIENFKKEYKEKFPDRKMECTYRMAGGVAWKLLPVDVKTRYLKVARTLMSQYKEGADPSVYKNWLAIGLETFRTLSQSDFDKSRSDSDRQSKSASNMRAGCQETSDDSKYKSDIVLEGGGPEVFGHFDTSKSDSNLEAPGDTDNSNPERDMQAGGFEACGHFDTFKSDSMEDDTVKSTPERDVQAGGLDAPGDFDTSKSDIDMEAAYLEAPGDRNKSDLERYVQAGGLEAPGDFDTPKSDKDMEAADLKAPGDADKYVHAGGIETPGDDVDNENNMMRPLIPCPWEVSVLPSSGGRGKGKARRKRGGLPHRLWRAAARRVTGCRAVKLSS